MAIAAIVTLISMSLFMRMINNATNQEITYGKFQENDPNAAALELVRTKQLPLDRQYLYDPQQALVFRRKFAGRGLVSYYFDRIGAVAADLGDRITCSGIIENAPITHIRMTGNQNGVRTRLEAYQDEFYPA